MEAIHPAEKRFRALAHELLGICSEFGVTRAAMDLDDALDGYPNASESQPDYYTLRLIEVLAIDQKPWMVNLGHRFARMAQKCNFDSRREALCGLAVKLFERIEECTSPITSHSLILPAIRRFLEDDYWGAGPEPRGSWDGSLDHG